MPASLPAPDNGAARAAAGGVAATPAAGRRAALLGGGALLAAPWVSRAQDRYPSKPVRFIVPYTPGGTTDGLSRILCQSLSEQTGQSFVIENRAGAGGNIGGTARAKAAPDGYTIGLVGISTNAIAPALYPSMPFDPIKDYTFVSMMASWPNLLVVHPSLPVQSVAELIELLRRHPDKYSFASSGSGTSIHLAAELFKSMTGTQMVHVPYKGSAPALQDLIAGRTQVMFDNMPSALPHVKSGRLRALGVTSAARNRAAPDIAPVADTVPGYEVDVWMGFAGPAGLPAPIVERLNAEARRALTSPELVQRYAQLGADASPSTPEHLLAYTVREKDKWARVVKLSGARVD